MKSAVVQRERLVAAFFEAEQDRLARACHAIAAAFAQGGTLVPFGTGPAATDAAHAAVEFMHPVIVGKRALPALAPGNDMSGASSAEILLRPGDIALAIAHRDDPRTASFLARARERELLTIALLPAGGGGDADFAFVVPSDDPHVVQEVQETAYHVLWELVHVFFEHPGLLERSCVTCGDVAVRARVVAVHNGSATVERGGAREEVATELVESIEAGEEVLCHAGVALERVEARAGAPAEPTGFLYPFLTDGETDLESVLADVRASTVQKARDVIELRRAIDLDAVSACANAIRARLARGGRLITFGNGGSSTDAQDAAADCLELGWPAAALTNDSATVTAIGNDVGFENVFARQLIPLARADDVALAISTSGSSPNVIAALDEARRRRMLTCAITGYDGGRLAALEWLDHLFVVRSDYVPRIQEAQATIYHLLLDALGPALR